MSRRAGSIREDITVRSQVAVALIAGVSPKRVDQLESTGIRRLWRQVVQRQRERMAA